MFENTNLIMTLLCIKCSIYFQKNWNPQHSRKVLCDESLTTLALLCTSLLWALCCPACRDLCPLFYPPHTLRTFSLAFPLPKRLDSGSPLDLGSLRPFWWASLLHCLIVGVWGKHPFALLGNGVLHAGQACPALLEGTHLWPWLCPHSLCRKARFTDTWGFRSGLCRGFWGNKGRLSNPARPVTEEASSDFMPEIDPGSGISWRELYPSSPLGSYIPTASRPGLKPSWQRGVFVAWLI